MHSVLRIRAERVTESSIAVLIVLYESIIPEVIKSSEKESTLLKKRIELPSLRLYPYFVFVLSKALHSSKCLTILNDLTPVLCLYSLLTNSSNDSNRIFSPILESFILTSTYITTILSLYITL